MAASVGAGWIRLGLLALPVYALLTFAATLTHQPDPSGDFGAYAAYISTTQFLAGHLIGSIVGSVLALLGVIALAAYLLRDGASNLVMVALVASVAGNALILPLFGVAAFASPAIGRAYLAGLTDVIGINDAIYGTPLIVTGLLGGLCYSAGTILFGVAIGRSADLPR